MKRSRVFLTGIILGGLLGAMMTLFWNPKLMKDTSFLLGVIACLSFVLLGLVSLLIWNRVKGNQDRAHSSKRIYIASFVMLVALLSCFLFSRQNELNKQQAQLQKNQFETQQALIESNRTSGLLFLLANIQSRMDDDIKQSPNRILSDETIRRITALSYFFKPYLTVGGDSLPEKKLSPERGYLLLAISQMNLDSACLHQIWSRTSFEWADLRNADLQNTDLKGTNLRGADLQDANLQGADLQKANLIAVNLWGANLSNADLTGVDLRRAMLSWADLNGAILWEANLNGVRMTSAQMRRSDLSGALVQWADLSYVFLNEATLDSTNFSGTNLQNANLTGAGLAKANLTLATVSGANFSGTNLTGTIFDRTVIADENWLLHLSDWNVTGGNEIKSNYKISKRKTHYLIEKIKK